MIRAAKPDFQLMIISGNVLQIDRNVGEDPRLEAFNKEWFQGKDCLDIGCNQGLVTIDLGNVCTFSPARSLVSWVFSTATSDHILGSILPWICLR
jgi:hypothetical protein